MLFLWISLVLLLLFSIYLFYSLVISGFYRFAPYVPAKRADLERIMRLADLKDGDILYDLGCGDGRVIIYAAINNNIKAVGVEKSFLLYVVCSVKKLFVRNRNIIFKWSDIYKEKYPDADAIFIYPNSSKNALRVYDKICKENGNELKLISYRFSIKDIEPDSVERAPAGLYSVYLYKLRKQYAKN